MAGVHVLYLPYLGSVTSHGQFHAVQNNFSPGNEFKENRSGGLNPMIKRSTLIRGIRNRAETARSVLVVQKWR